jgi:DNA-binding transcriptional ArsR family regulator
MPENESRPGEEKLLILPLGEESKKITQVISNDTARQIIELLADAPLSASDIAERLKVPLTTIVYNLENLEKVGLIKIEKIRYSEKGREMKIYAPVRKLIVVIPERTDKKSVTDLLKKYLGVIFAAFFASGLIEIFTRSAEKNRVMFEVAEKSMDSILSSESMIPNATILPATIMNGTTRGGEILSGTPIPTATPVTGFINESIPASAYAPVAQDYAEYVNVTAGPVPVATLDSSSLSKEAPDIFTRIADTITAHPGLVFLLGCLFAVILLMMWEYGRKRMNGQIPGKK